MTQNYSSILKSNWIFFQIEMICLEQSDFSIIRSFLFPPPPLIFAFSMIQSFLFSPTPQFKHKIRHTKLKLYKNVVEEEL